MIQSRIALIVNHVSQMYRNIKNVIHVIINIVKIVGYIYGIKMKKLNVMDVISLQMEISK